MSGSNGSAARVFEAYRRKGQRITLRRVTTMTPAEIDALGYAPPLIGSENLRNPPELTEPTIRVGAAGHDYGDVGGAMLQGLLFAGDRFRPIGETTWLTLPALCVLGASSSDPLALSSPDLSVDFSPAWPAGWPVGQAVPIEFAWVADTPWWGRVESFPQQLVDGANILTGDLRVSMPSYGLSAAPKQGDRILLQGTVDAEIVTCNPLRAPGGAVTHWHFLAR